MSHQIGKKTYLAEFLFKAFIFVFLSVTTLSLYAVEPENYFTYLGGDETDGGIAIARDSLDALYITGDTNSAQFFGFDETGRTTDNQSCYVARIDIDSPGNNYFFQFAGNGRDICRDIAVDDEFNVYITGETLSTDLPMTTSKTHSGDWDAFLIKLDSVGNLVYASYIGGENIDFGHGIAIKENDNVFIVGETWSQNFPTTSNGFLTNCKNFDICDGDKSNAFLIQIDTSSTKQLVNRYSTYFGGDDQDKAHSVAIDSDGIVHIGGETSSSDFPLVNPYSNQKKGTFDGFVAKFDIIKNASNSLIFSTLLGGNGDDSVNAITTDKFNNSVVSGETSSDDFPTTTNAFSSRCATGIRFCNSSGQKQHIDGFVSLLKTIGNIELSYSTLLGGSENDSAHSVTINESSLITVSGSTFSSDFPITNNAYDDTCNDGSSCKNFSDGFIFRVDLNKNSTDSLVFSSFFGGNDNDNITDAYEDFDNSAYYFTGKTASSNLATDDALVSQIDNANAYLRKLRLFDDGQWIDNRPPPANSAKKSFNGLFFIYILMLFLLSSRLTKYFSKLK